MVLSRDDCHAVVRADARERRVDIHIAGPERGRRDLLAISSAEFINRAWRFKHQFGGAMRQAGIIAAAGVYALENHVERLADDHANARHFAELVAEIPGVSVDLDSVQTNMIYFDTSGSGLSAPQVNERLLAQGIRIGDMDDSVMRAVTHIDVDRAGIEIAARALREVIQG